MNSVSCAFASLFLAAVVSAEPAASPALRLEPQLYLFRAADFRAITVSGQSLTAQNRAIAVVAPATVSFDDATLRLGAQAAWSGGAAPAALAPVTVPVVESAFDRPAWIRSELPAQYFEPRGDGVFALRETASGSAEVPHYQLTFRVQPANASNSTLHVTCEPEIVTVQSRERLAGVDLDVGKPVTAVFKDRLEFDAQPGEWSALVFRSPNGSAYSALLLLRVTPKLGEATTASVPAKAAATDPQAPARVEVTFVDPDSFSDAGDGIRGSSFGRDDNLDQLRNFLVRRGPRFLQKGQTLQISVTDVDLAGEIEGWQPHRAQNVRIVRDGYPPRIDLEFRLVDATGAVIKEGKRHLPGTNFMLVQRPFESELRHFEFDLLEDWLRSEFPRPPKR